MIKLSQILAEIKKQISYKKPNFKFEWGEAKRYREFKKLKKAGWIAVAEKGKPVKYTQIKGRLGNVDLNFNSLDPNKKKRFKSAFEIGQIERPIAAEFSDGSYDLVAGNTRLSGLVKAGYDPEIWVVKVPKNKSK